jgi:prepilin-type N-terminal cleavage/methylation domain-containing protein
MKKPFLSLSHRGAGGFSLIELLVVTTIMSVMIALLMPSLSQARSVARITLCKSKLHHIGVAEMSYAADNKANYIINYMPGASNSMAYNYNFIMTYDFTYNGWTVPRSNVAWDDYLTGGGRGMHCPEYYDGNPPATWGTPVWNGNTTAPNGAAVVPYYYVIRYQIWAGTRNAFNMLPNNYRGQGNREIIPLKTDDKRRKMFHHVNQLPTASTDAPLANCVYSLSNVAGQLLEWSHTQKGMNSLQTDGSVKWKVYPGSPVMDYSGDPDVIKFAHNYNSVGAYTGVPFWDEGF